MRLYVRVLDEEAPGWWRAVGAVGSSGSGAGVGREGGGEEETRGGGGGGTSRWALVPTGVAEGSRPPPPRGGHSATVIPGTSRAFVFGK